MHKIKRPSIGLGLGAIALLVAFVGTSIAGQSAETAKKPKARTKTTPVTQQIQLPPQTINEGKAQFDITCPGGTTVSSGGGSFPGALATIVIQLFESGPTGNGWHIRYDNDEGTFEAASIYAICLKNKLKVKGEGKGKARTKLQQVSQQVLVPADVGVNPGITEANVNCPSGTTLVGGGTLFAPGTSPVADIQLYESGPAGNGWHARFNNDQAIAQLTSIQAICENNKLKVKGGSGGKKRKARTRVQQVTQQLLLPPSTAATNNGRAEGVASCPSGTTVVGGGVTFAPGTPIPLNDIELLQSFPQGNGWQVRADNEEATARAVSIQAICQNNKLKVK